MTQKQAKNWLPEITYWANGGTLWFLRTINNNITQKVSRTWHKHLSHSPLSFKGENKNTYVIEDKHFEARKAFALGEPIEIRCGITTPFKNTLYPAWVSGCEYRSKPKEWYNNIPEEGVLCWVWDNIKMKYTAAEKVIKYIDEEYPYSTEIDNQFMYAEPVKPDECHTIMKKTVLTEKEVTDFKIGDWVTNTNTINNSTYQLKGISEPILDDIYKLGLRLATEGEIYKAGIDSCKSSGHTPEPHIDLAVDNCVAFKKECKKCHHGLFPDGICSLLKINITKDWYCRAFIHADYEYQYLYKEKYKDVYDISGYVSAKTVDKNWIKIEETKKKLVFN